MLDSPFICISFGFPVFFLLHLQFLRLISFFFDLSPFFAKLLIYLRNVYFLPSLFLLHLVFFFSSDPQRFYSDLFSYLLMTKAGLPPFSKMHEWNSTNSKEKKKFLRNILYMGVVKVNPISNYWSKSPTYNFQ